MDSDEGKLFIGGIGWETTEDTLRDHFNQYGDVSQVVIMRDKTTGRPRGFGFVVFSDPSLLDRVLHDSHTIDGRTVEAKKALSREEQHSSTRSGSHNAGRGSENGGNFRTKKIFVGGLPSSLTEDGFCRYFENYGPVTDVVVMYDQHTQRPRGFGFITFDSEDAVDRVLHKTFHELNGKLVEVKRALPKDAFPGSGARGGGYQGSGASGVNSNLGDGRMNGNRYMQAPISAGGYPPYSVYGAAHYAYGMANSGVGYGSYGSFGVGAYGSGSTGFGGPTGAYGMTGTLRSAWGSQTPSSYGASSYGGSAYSANVGYGATAPWNASGSGNSVSAPMGPSPTGTSGYGNQGYGYGHYGGTDGSYSNGYGATSALVVNGPNSISSSGDSGFERQASGSGYASGGNNGN